MTLITRISRWFNGCRFAASLALQGETQMETKTPTTRLDINKLRKDMAETAKALKLVKAKLRTPHQPEVTWRDYHSLKSLKREATMLYCIRAWGRKNPRIHLPGMTLEKQESFIVENGTWEKYILPAEVMPLQQVG